MADLDNKEKLVPVKVKVNQAGYPETLCSYIKGDGDRKDLFIVDNVDTKGSDVLVVTPDVVEALGRKERAHLGIINPVNGDVLIPLENKDIIVASNNIFVVISNNPTTLEVKNALSAKSSGDFSKVSELESAKNSITAQMNKLSESFDMLFSDPFSEARAYKIKLGSKNGYCVEPLSLPASFIGMDDKNIYSHTNVLNSSVKTISYNNVKTEDIAVVGVDDKKIELPSDIIPDKIEMPVMEKSKEESKNVSVEVNSVPIYDKLFNSSENGNDVKIEKDLSKKYFSVEKPKFKSFINTDNVSPEAQLDKINSLLEDFVKNNPTDELKRELRQARNRIDKLSADLKESMGLNKTLTSKCTDYQNESYALSATNKDLETKLAQYKDRNAEMKDTIASLESKLAQMSAKLSHTLTLFSSLVGNSSIQLNEDSEIKRKVA